MTNPSTPPPQTDEKLRLTSPPYFRFPLHHGRHNQRRRLSTNCNETTGIASADATLPELPTALEQADISKLEWFAFWHELQALFAHPAQRLEWHGTGLCVLVTLLWLHHVLYGLRYYAADVPPLADWSWSVVLIGLASIVGPFLLYVLYHRRQHALFMAVQSYCQKSDKSTAAFDRHGFTVTCELVPTAKDGYQPYLYIVPVDMPCTRLEVYQTCRASNNGDRHVMETGHGDDEVESCGRGTTTKRPNVPIPADLRERLPLQDWNDFWFDMKMVTQDVENGWCDQTFWILLAVSAVLSVLMVVTILDDVPLSILVLLGFVSLTTYPFLYIVYRWYACVWSQVTLVRKYSMQFSRHGVFVEHRRLVAFHPWLGPFERHYVDMYVAPPPPPPSCGSEWTLVTVPTK